ncbi:hypothetical protein GTO27_06895 [Candidatus Bathyarchaeota archaeon]|nr:hypothetical protein [Candidatus Bathyarchaeota archaeon]
MSEKVDDLVNELENEYKARQLWEKQGLTFEEIAERTDVAVETLKTWADNNEWDSPPVERKLRKVQSDKRDLDRKYRNLLDDYNDLLDQMGLLEELGPPTIAPIRKKKPSGTTEATAIITLSDWHFEEEVLAESVNGLNEFNLEIAKQRTDKCFQNGLRLTDIIAKEVKITTILMPLLGDFISNDIHEEFRETNKLLPMEAMEAVQESLASGIHFILKNSKYDIILNCHSGNHGRTTKNVFISTEHGHSLEYFMYRNLAKYFEKEKRVKFNIQKGYHSYQDVYDMTLRFHHGHGIRYYGGVGGLYIPANKAIAQWNKARHADLDVFGHFHQMKDGGHFVTNGSLIGYNAYALSIKADYEPPRQAFFVIDSKRGKTFTCPIRVD